ncbi:signal peptide peptidase SppA [Marinigracilibium pacificum]|uniref:Signal peptide peptidase SppA n=1 Tax=Marinigracilibium pacificum TaxID=2729599 RepID=A0A848J3W5_9BACT|nr:signal peptide peptidase SppA [Marinigracilibium pacificum]NMM50205.1 signal peptide peptidase SppA [Marinigracilibium pacificum]
MNFLKGVLATLVGLIIFCALIFFITVGIGSAIASGDKIVVKDNSVLHIRLDKPITEREITDPFLILTGQGEGSYSLHKLKSAIRKAAKDPSIKGILLEPASSAGGYASLRELRKTLLEFKETDKFIIAYDEILTERGYYLASVADEIYLSPEGMMELDGFSATVTFFQGTLEKLNVKPYVFKVGEFKSAVEPYLRKDMSPASRLQTEIFLNGMFDTYVSDVSESRGIEKEKIYNIADSMMVRNGADAVEFGLISSIKYHDEVMAELRSRLGEDEDDDINSIGISDYQKLSSDFKMSDNKVAVLIANGAIMSGNDDNPEIITSGALVKEIKKLREDDNVKAVVLRVNSPGGSALASDVIWREIEMLKKKKPVIASMGDVAASGGYYISTGCDTIVAEPNTITGSIGIFGLWLYAGEGLEKHLGITTDNVTTGKFSDLFSRNKELTPYEESIFQDMVEEGYDTFTSKVAEGRGLSQDSVKAIGSGRVWIGTDAKEIGLVDVLGGVDTAIEIAAEKAGISDDYKVSIYPYKKKKFIEELMTGLADEASVKARKEELGVLAPFMDAIEQLQTRSGIQARAPFDIEIN